MDDECIFTNFTKMPTPVMETGPTGPLEQFTDSNTNTETILPVHLCIIGFLMIEFSNKADLQCCTDVLNHVLQSYLNIVVLIEQMDGGMDGWMDG